MDGSSRIRVYAEAKQAKEVSGPRPLGSAKAANPQPTLDARNRKGAGQEPDLISKVSWKSEFLCKISYS